MTVLRCLTAATVMSGKTDVVGGDLGSWPPGARAVPRSLGSLSPAIPDSDPDLWLYRERTLGMLRRYLRLSVEVGRLPFLLGREFF